MNCPKCGKPSIFWAHAYYQFGHNGVFYCRSCKGAFKVIIDRKTGRRKIGCFIKIMQHLGS